MGSMGQDGNEGIGGTMKAIRGLNKNVQVVGGACGWIGGAHAFGHFEQLTAGVRLCERFAAFCGALGSLL